MADGRERASGIARRRRDDKERRITSTTEHARLLSIAWWRNCLACSTPEVAIQRQFQHVEQQVVFRQQIRY